MKLVDRHPLGFTKVNLLSVRGWRLRLHVWHGRSSELPHNHRWAFTGLPLLGTYTDTRWTATVGVSHRRITTRPSTAPGGRAYSTTGTPCGLTADEVRIRRPLRPYRCPAGDIHSYAPRGRGPHLSLVLLAPAASDVSTVWEPR